MSTAALAPLSAAEAPILTGERHGRSGIPFVRFLVRICVLFLHRCAD